MKKLVLVTLPILLVLSGCTVDPTQPGSNSIDNQSTIPDERTDCIYPIDPTRADIIAYDKSTNQGQFSLEEFKDITFKFESSNGFDGKLYVNETVIEEDMYTSRYIFASDIDNDGYRELIYDRNKRDNEKAGNYFVVYDVKNMKVLLDEASTKERSHYNYRFDYGLIEDKLTFYPYIGNYSESSIVDYGYLRYTSEKGLYFEWKNIFAITSIELVKFYINDTDKTEVLPVNNVYTFKVGTKYCMEYKVNRTNTDRALMNSFLSVFWDNDHPSHFNEYQPSRTENDPANGKYVDNFSVLNPIESGTWEFFFGEFGFNVNYKVEA